MKMKKKKPKTCLLFYKENNKIKKNIKTNIKSNIVKREKRRWNIN